ncbi:MAG TPA: SUMF1/EgtB/PvdO family nonheme iron enzyme, partial [Gammaproteobacteria bacterium]|nr:SUMF1/EgtB/PvdO family nonheme iron enzyme [Gammaproteobacteria bacterium]
EQGEAEAKRRRDEEAAGLRNSINAALTQPNLTLAAAKDTLAEISRLAALGDADPLATQGREQVAEKLARQATDAGNSGQRWEQVAAQLDQALALIAGSPSLQSARAGAQANVERAREGERVARAAEVQQAVDALLAAPRYDAPWVKEIRDRLASMNGLVPEVEIAQRQQRAAELLVARGAERRGDERFAEANAALSLAATLAPKLGSLVAEQQLLKDAMDASARATGAARLAAEIEALKGSFMTSVDANSTAEANAKLAELKSKLPANDPFLTTTAPQALADVDLRLARARVAEQDYDRAEQLIAQGLALWPSSEPLKTLSGDVRAARDQRLTKNVAGLRAQLDRGAGDANEGKRVLAQIRSDAGAGFATLERELTARAEAHIGANGADDAYRAYAAMVFGRDFARPATAAPPVAPPAAAAGTAPSPTAVPRPAAGARACTPAMAGQGRLGARAWCYDAFGASVRGPELVVAPAGGGHAGPFAITRMELKVGNWNDYCKASGKCAERTDAPTNPVTNVSAAEAEEYAAWLTQQTGFAYRLPTREEWEYVASAPRQNPKNFNCINSVNGKGGTLLATGESGNDWGVVDYLGNVQEWVKTDSGFEARGGHYDTQLAQCTVDHVDARSSGAGDEHTGVRLVREMPGA